MATTRFLFNRALWSELQTRVARPGRVRAAVAYVGKGGAQLLPLKLGDELIVDMSLPTVRQGATYPKAIRTLIRRGVKVWTRESLHAKFFILGNAVFAGSANVSKNAHDHLDEAALLTTDSAAVRQALSDFARMQTEPVRPKYLAKCIEEYRPPVFKGGHPTGGKRARQEVRAKLWFVSGLTLLDLSDADEELSDAADARAKKRLKLPGETEIDWIRFSKRPWYHSSIQPGDWVVSRVRPEVGAPYCDSPRQVLGFDTLKSARGKVFHRILLEQLSAGQNMAWSVFQRRVATAVPELGRERPRSGPITDEASADAILRMWSMAGRIVRKKRRSS